HGGGFLPSYASRSDAVCTTFPNRVGPLPKKKPTEYIRGGQLLFDTIMFTGEGMRHLIAEAGIDQVVLGTDYPFPWNTNPVDPRPQRRGPDQDSRRDDGETDGALAPERLPGKPGQRAQVLFAAGREM